MLQSCGKLSSMELFVPYGFWVFLYRKIVTRINEHTAFASQRSKFLNFWCWDNEVPPTGLLTHLCSSPSVSLSFLHVFPILLILSH